MYKLNFMFIQDIYRFFILKLHLLTTVLLGTPLLIGFQSP